MHWNWNPRQAARTIVLGASLSICPIAGWAAGDPPGTGSAILTMTGRITPPACSLDFSNHGNVNFDRAYSSLDADGTKLEAKSIDLAIQCAMPTRLGITLKDMRAASRIATGEVSHLAWGDHSVANLSDTYTAFGLGTVSGTDGQAVKIGAFMINVGKVTVDGGSGAAATTDQNSWLTYRYLGWGTWLLHDVYAKGLYTFWKGSYPPDGQTPRGITTASMTLDIVPTIARKASLPIRDEILLDGMVNVELRYL
ncbi:DUF1120 domain-containing protein [Burkholderia gladioli]|uniref:DUF1120 domain-containing protein n=1 Tax=Burkholderia gladioli TaxID=28095 RepID=UPI000F80E965|nr:DUF1120 domain-containing protein [Burkholderia gladioli]MBU9187243.1 DUF1120 domain-containing protein [Burkholderia gladioli]